MSRELVLLSSLLMVVVISCGQNNAENSASEFTDNTMRAKEVVSLLANEDFSGAAQYFDDTMKKALPPEKLREVWHNVISQAGHFKQEVRVRSEKAGKHNIVFVTSGFDNSTLDIKFVFNSSKQIAGLFFVPSS